MTAVFDGANLRLVRCAQGLSLADVGEAVEKSKQYIQRIEAGTDTPTSQLVDALASFLNVEPEFLFAGDKQALREDVFHFRKLIGTKPTDKQAAMATGELFRKIVDFIDSTLRLPRVDFPEHDIGSPEAAERAAEKCRIHWGLGVGPIGNMVRVVENAGAVVTTFESAGRGIDALSIAAPRPIVVTNSNDVSACRVRFDHAHEIGHLVGHVGRSTGDKATEAEANRFASAFLLPRSSFAKEFPALRGGTQINWIALSEMKMRWRVSKAALLYRARQLGILSEDLYKRALIGHLFAKGERYGEREDPQIPHESPELFDSAISLLSERLGMSLEQIAASVKMKKALLLLVAPQARALERRSTSAVVSLRAYRKTAPGRV
ncbi:MULTISPECIES: helix-turn-helix domain-containing protein [Burkholderia]|uniref:helix-turn-helix domain-containing protein n=1 Tax=Burkholderia TaxID=32008 RepID=UPI0009BE9232|nr:MULTISPECIES: XRE family transcriptional regulator [Burkholderia]